MLHLSNSARNQGAQWKMSVLGTELTSATKDSLTA